jgi:hypothetical protein
VFLVRADETEALCCSLCRKAFRSLDTAYLASLPTGGDGRWVHKRCLDGQADVVLGQQIYRLRRGDFVLKALVSKLCVHTI